MDHQIPIIHKCQNSKLCQITLQEYSNPIPHIKESRHLMEVFLHITFRPKTFWIMEDLLLMCDTGLVRWKLGRRSCNHASTIFCCEGMVVMSVSQRTTKSARLNQSNRSNDHPRKLFTVHFNILPVELRGRLFVIYDFFSLSCLLWSSSTFKCLTYGIYHSELIMHYMFNLTYFSQNL